jgi:hypothetical protein
MVIAAPAPGYPAGLRSLALPRLRLRLSLLIASLPMTYRPCALALACSLMLLQHQAIPQVVVASVL